MSALYTIALAALTALPPATVATASVCEGGCDIAIQNVRIVDVAEGRVLPERTVVVDDGMIHGIVEPDVPVIADQVIDGSGAYLMPGLIDMHVHTDRSALPLFLEHGVTTIRDMGTHFAPLEPDSGGQLALREEIAAGSLAGPEMVLALRILDGPVDRDPRWAMHFASIDSPEQGRAMVNRVAGAGGDLIKVYTDLTPEVFAAIADEAGRLGLPLAGHVPGQVGYTQAALAGLDTAEHLRGIFMDLSADEAIWRAEYAETAALGDPSATYEFSHRELLRIAATLDPQKEADLISTLRSEGVGIVPTLVVLDDPRWRYPTAVPDPELVSRLSPIYQAIVTPQGEVSGPFETVAQALEAFEIQSSLVRRLHEGGVDILVGTDAANPFVLPGIAMHEELGNLVRAGLSPAESLRAATLVNARYLGFEERLGSIEIGKEADLVLIEDNPLQDIAATRSIVAIIVNGQVHGALDAPVAAP